ncbi:MAG: ATP-binding protein, partial [Desulfuromonadaceae bacterium]
LVYAELSMGALARQSAQVVYRSVAATEGGRALAAGLIALERQARQFEVLGEERLQQEMDRQHGEIQETLERLLLLPLEAPLLQRVRQLQADEAILIDRLQREPRESEQRQQVLTGFAELHNLANVIEAQSQELIYHEVEEVQKFSAEAQRKMIWQAAVLVPLSGLFLVLFVRLISRPIVHLDRAINRLGERDFSTVVRISGSWDLARLGERLDWMRSQLADVERAKTRFVSHISHELKTPLASMREGSELLRDDLVGELNPQQREIVEILCKSSRDLQSLIENLLGFSKVQAGTVGLLNRTQLDVAALLDELCGDFKPLLVKKELCLDVVGAPLTLTADREQLRTLLGNLLSNAVKFTPRGGRILVSWQQDEEGCSIEVTDSGPGIDPADRERLFDPFFQGSRPGSGPVKGTGLGLSIAREIARSHGGELSLLDGTAPGCCMRLTLPLDQSE